MSALACPPPSKTAKRCKRKSEERLRQWSRDLEGGYGTKRIAAGNFRAARILNDLPSVGLLVQPRPIGLLALGLARMGRRGGYDRDTAEVFRDFDLVDEGG